MIYSNSCRYGSGYFCPFRYLRGLGLKSLVQVVLVAFLAVHVLLVPSFLRKGLFHFKTYCCVWLQEQVSKLQTRLAEAEAADAARLKPEEESTVNPAVVADAAVVDEWVCMSLFIAVYSM